MRQRLAAVTGLALALALALLLPARPAQAAGIQQALLVQNSGWMEPFYADPASPFKPLVAAVAQAVAGPDDTLHLLAFSQATPGNDSPRLLHRAQGAAGIAQHLAPLQVARKGAGAALADTDFREAVTRTITGPFGAAPGIVWIFTNNRNSPGNDARTAERNRDFYRLLHLEPSITKTLAFPLRMPVQGQHYSARGLMVYALAYGRPAAQALDAILALGALGRVLTQPPARLKPLDADAVRIVPEAVKDLAHARVSLGADGRTVVLDVDAARVVPEMVLRASLQNLFYPYEIRHAAVQAALSGGGQRSALHVAPDRVQALAPGARQPVEIRLALPMAQIPSAWSAQALSAMGKRVLLPLSVDIGLSGQRLGVSDGFVALMQELFPGDPISEVFTPPEEVRASQARVPLLLRLQYPLAPVAAAVGAVLALVLGAALLAFGAGRSHRFELVVDGVRRPIVLKRFAALEVHDAQGRPAGRVRRAWGRPRVAAVEDGHTVAFTGR